MAENSATPMKKTTLSLLFAIGIIGSATASALNAADPMKNFPMAGGGDESMCNFST